MKLEFDQSLSFKGNQYSLHEFLEYCVERFNQPGFIEDDPISIPHLFSKKQDIEIMGFWTATLAWGQRTTIINSSMRLIELMDGAPHDFIKNHQEKDRKRFLSFKHRTFQSIDTLYFLDLLQRHYQAFDSLESAFTKSLNPSDLDTSNALIGFHKYFFDQEHAPRRTQKHVATPARKSSCKRLNMFLRWMVREDGKGVDFGIWKKIKPAQLMMPLDVHVDRIARRFGLLERKQRDWKAVIELTRALRKFDPNDPVKYDFALFGLGVLEKKEGWPVLKHP